MRKTLTITAVVLMFYAVSPARVKAQLETPDSVRIEELRRRVNLLDDVSAKIGALGERVNGVAESQKALQAQMDSLSGRVWAGMVGAFMLLLERAFAAFGVKIRDKGSSAEKA